MNFNYNIKVTDNTPQLHEALEAWVERVLIIWGMKVQDYAQQLVPTGTADSTGIEGYVGDALKASIIIRSRKPPSRRTRPSSGSA